MIVAKIAMAVALTAWLVVIGIGVCGLVDRRYPPKGGRL